MTRFICRPLEGSVVENRSTRAYEIVDEGINSRVSADGILWSLLCRISRSISLFTRAGVRFDNCSFLLDVDIGL